jgi:hypothetical protein
MKLDVIDTDNDLNLNNDWLIMNDEVIDFIEESDLVIDWEIANEDDRVLSEVNILLVIALVVIDCDKDL